MPRVEERIYHPADVLFGKCENVPASVEAVQFHGVVNTKHEALVREIAHLYTAGVTSRGDADYSLFAGKESFAGRGENGDQTFNFSLLKPFLGWQKYSNIGLSMYRSLATLPWNLSDTEENGLVMQYNGQLWDKKLFHNLKLNTIWRKFTPSKDAAFAVREHAGHTMKCSMENSLTYDTRDRPILATQGTLLKFTQEYAGFFGDAAFLKHQIDAQASVPLFLGIFASASYRFSIVNALSDRSVHLLDRLYVGGPHDLRGFHLNTISSQASGSCSLGNATSSVAVFHLYRYILT
ncbi:unnamed protein product [Gongylonema pulchrum]|uniref:Bac_surface_Ag domain-containing protein n=1 Tax=Gongylonema pulchrum TaxID=637853 RepID=A0A183EHG8_9BILA|nr:unnamed protein product [Gongylonema pulchrum]